jgi:uncharacterized protein YndB with AHSA1/START domain
MITKDVLLPCVPERAFELFTRGINDWWPSEHRPMRDPAAVIVLLEQGRFFQRDPGGGAVELGAVLAWDAPRRLVLAWYMGTDSAHPTNVVVTFVPEGEGTRVQVQHTPTAASEGLFPARAPRYEASWGVVLAALARASAK